MSSVSVVIPVRDAAPYIEQAIGSVLAGSMRPDEVIVVDDGSSDGSADLADAVGGPVRVIRQDAAGIAAATNAGVAAADGELIAYVDADDLWTSEKLELQLGAIEADPSLDAVFGAVREFISPELSAVEAERLVCRPGAHPAKLRGAALLRRELFERAGPFDETLVVGEFVDWYARAQRAGARERMLDAVVLHRRLHLANHGRRAAAARLDFVRIARRQLAERRG